MMLAHYLEVMQSRAQFLALIIPIAYFIGAAFARGYFTQALRAGQRLITRLGQKLDRPERGPTTLIYRGMVALLMLLIPMVGLSLFLVVPVPWRELLVVFLLIAWFGQAFNTLPDYQLWRRARAGRMTLESVEYNRLFTDTHALLRHRICMHMTAFHVDIVGGSFWYMLADLPAMTAYLIIMAAARSYDRGVFGWAARQLARIMTAIPTAITLLLLRLAAIFIPGTRSLASLRSGDILTATADILGIALEGSLHKNPSGWVGSGTAKVMASHFGCTLGLILVAMVWLTLLLASPTIIAALHQ